MSDGRATPYRAAKPTCPHCGAPGKLRAERPGIVSSGVDFECGVIWDDSAHSDFKAQHPRRGCLDRIKAAK